VEAIEGVHGNAAKQRDWFWYVNGIEGDRSAAEYRLHPGDVEWWDYRSWKRQMRVPVVVGAFPEPFLHGYDGKRAAVTVIAEQFGLAYRREIDRIQEDFSRLLHASDRPTRRGYVFVIGPTTYPFHAQKEEGRIVFRIGFRDADRLLAHPDLAKFRYQGLRP